MTTVVFSGHMVDGPGREVPRFPPAHVPRVAAAIEGAVTAVGDPAATAVAGAACGGDLLFCEAWLTTGRRLTVFLPRAEDAFLEESVRFAGQEWETAFERVVSHPHTTLVGPAQDASDDADAHAANNRRMLVSALRAGPPLHGIFVWDRGGGDGPGGTGQMVAAIEQAGGHVTIIEP